MDMDFQFSTQGSKTYLVWKIRKSDEVDELIKGMLENNDINGVLPVSFTQSNDERIFRYDVTGMVAINDYFQGKVQKNSFLKIVHGILDVLDDVEKYMISDNNVYFDTKFTFVNPKNLEVGIIILPVVNIDSYTDVSSFLKSMMFGLQFDATDDSAYVTGILNYLNSDEGFNTGALDELIKGYEQGHKRNNEDLKIQRSSRAKRAVGQNNVVTPKEKPESLPVRENSVSIPQHVSQPTPQTAVPPMPAAAQQPAVPPMPAAAQQPAIPPMPAVPPMPAQSPKKEKKSLFRRKKKDNIPQPNIPQPNTPIQIPGNTGIEIPQMKEQPGVVTIPKKKSGLFGKKKKNQEVVAPPLQQQNPVNMQPISRASNVNIPQMQKVQSDFGDTVLLNEDNMGTTLLDDTTNETTLLNAGSSPYIIRNKTNERVYINSNTFRIGKEKSKVDFFVSDNTAISRNHAEIILINGEYYFRDNNSLNHSYLEGRMIRPDEQVKLENGARLRLADEEFEFWIE